MAKLEAVTFDPFKASPLDLALNAEGVNGQLADVARSIYMQESGGGKNTKTSNAGAVGGMQIIPSTFKSVADQDWDINDPIQNARAGVRYIKQLNDMAGGDPKLIAAGYYGGPGGLQKARNGQAVSDPRNPRAPNTLQYADQVASRLPNKGVMERVAEAVIPAANASPRIDDMSGLEPVDFNPFAQEPKQEGPGLRDRLVELSGAKIAKNLAGGALRGAGSIGATILAPIDIASDALAGKGLSLESNRQRRADITGGLQSLGVDTESVPFQVGKIGAEIAGTAGVGNALAIPARAAGAAGLGNALASGGMTLGNAAPQSAVGNMLLRTVGGAMTGGAAAGLVNPEEARTGALIGGAIPGVTKAAGMAGNAIGRAVSGSPVSPEVQQLARRAQDLGIQVPADRIANSKPLNALAASLEYVPFSGRTGTIDQMQSQFNTAISRTFGQDSENVTAALRKANADLGGKFDQVLKANSVAVDQQFLQELADAANMASRELGTEGQRVIQNQVDDIIAKAGSGQIDGQAAYNIKKTLDRIGKRNTPEAFYATDLKQKLMGALNRSLGPDEAAKFAETRKQYGNMLTLQKMAQNGADGDISIARVANLKNINNPELQEIADIAAQFLRSREGQHGAAQRTVLGVGAALTGGATGTLPAIAGGMLGARAANSMLNSSAARNRLLGGSAIPLEMSIPAQELFYRSAPVLAAQ